MPKGVIKTPAQEKKWERAKDIAAEQGKAKRWPLIMQIFRQMGGMSKTDQDQRNHLVDQALKSEDKHMPLEVHELTYSWLSSKAKKLSKAQHLDEMHAALSALRNELSEQLTKAEEKKDKTHGEWSQHPNHTPEELTRIAKLVNEGYHPREAAHLISPTTGGRGEPRNFMRALESYVRPTQLSPRMHAEAKKVAQQWLDNYESHLAERAKPEINPVIHASAKLKQAHQDKTADYHKAYTDFLASDELKGKSPMERHKAVQAWKQSWKEKNPEKASTSGLSEAAATFKEAEEARKKYVEEAKHHLVHGGAPVEPTGVEDEVESSAPMSARAISEHMGIGGSEEDDAPKISAKQDPSMKFAGAHKKYIESVLKPQVGEAKPRPAPEQITPAPEQEPAAAPAPAPQPEKPKTIIRRVAKPDQQERMKHIDAAKMSLQTKKD